MTKPTSALVLVTIIICGLATINTQVITAQTPTQVNGVISQNTTWTKTNSPHTLTDNVLVSNGVTLTIEAGVTVNLNGNKIEVNGTIQAIGNNANPIAFNSGQIAFTQYSAGWSETSGGGSIISYAALEASVSIIESSPMISNSNISSVGVIVGVSGGSPIISNNKITSFQYSDQYGRSQQSYAGIQLSENSNAIIIDNVITGTYDQACIIVNDGSPIIQKNLIQYGNGLYFGAMSTLSNPTIQNNTFSFCREAILSATGSSGLTSLLYNNFVNSSQYNIYWAQTTNLNATLNWWGTTDQQAINQTIHDFKNDFNLGNVNFIPWLNSPNSQAPNSALFISNPSPTTPPPSPISTPITSEFPSIVIVIVGLVIMTLTIVTFKRKEKSIKQANF
jgi:hypothetical protein